MATISRTVETTTGQPGLDRIAVAVHAADRRLADQLEPALAVPRELCLLAASESALADVVLVISEMVTDSLVGELIAMSAAARRHGQCFVLVAGPLRERHLPRLFGAGVVSILPYRDVTAHQVVRTVLASHSGQAVLPAGLTRWLVEETRFMRTNLLATQGVTAGGLTVREVEVIRLIAQGEETAGIASRLSYSERTIKKIVKDLMSRLDLRNRAHAVSYALRVGAI
ncbi:MULTISPECIES: LuxR C-terminal-related transcriptional regulator [unclassified Crossiella]|uniref:helix-turn-helix transcriptional regulator n=1 Tax=unclassified Crossiella TaxID=2620835 RepID=UPI001FFEB047|nr:MULTISPECIES: LuxR C-terminal-related transcriptional regulator [unclassified Crossiella]MCK2239276.1 LuxR C-terminal-related transcriptional regulator [Crossiella sp. S99.2]MCK2251154.1 LuxR C-terminal-related transcriptional regulator [Crossiella sp. S99.1]